MKKIILISLVSVLFMGCELSNVVSNMYYENNINKCDIYYGDFEDIKNESDIIKFINNNITYKVSDGYTWATPEEILTRGYGDCKEFTRLYLNILYVITGETGNGILVDYDRSIVEGGFVNHVIVELSDGTQIEPQNGEICHFEIGFRYGFYEFFN